MLSLRYPLGRIVFQRAFSCIGGLRMSESNLPVEYEKWTKKKLIDKIRQLESKSTINGDSPTPEVGAPLAKKAKKRVFDINKHPKRFVALKFAYLGWNYNGLAYQYEETPLPTVEETILQALATAKLIAGPNPESCKFSRCGRTDKGVSAMNQVISIDLRSALTEEEQKLKENDHKEIKYLSIINSILPADIRVNAICLRPPENFDARFSCSYRHYRYLFKKMDLDIDLMNEAANKYEGVHDFRNFCKLDGSKQITNFTRLIHSAKIIHLQDDIYAFDLKGSAFLWHQVRCMVAILFLVAQKLEKPAIIDDLMNVEMFPTKPVYEMAHDVPLILYDCAYPEMEWSTPNEIEDIQKFFKHFSMFKGILTDYQLKTHITGIMSGLVLKDSDKIVNKTGGNINLGNGTGRNYNKYVPLHDRDVGESFEIVNARHKEKKKRRIEAREEDCK
ncbi:pseudouridine synthase [Scheffersomyces coipomensis]|uniref:pseudouridine synthase n=1 Tax=Scheffersomyces coipomensis TaxID=1788519 RepID=UPI00315D44AB